jgi:hypothetical protein
VAVKPDVIIVHNGRAMREGLDVKTAAAGDWLVGPNSVRHLKYLISADAGSDVLGVYDITGYHPVPHRDDGRRFRFEISECDRRVTGEIPRMYGAFIYKHSSEMFGDGRTVPTGRPKPPPKPARRLKPRDERPAVCPRCQLTHSLARPDECPW